MIFHSFNIRCWWNISGFLPFFYIWFFYLNFISRINAMHSIENGTIQTILHTENLKRSSAILWFKNVLRPKTWHNFSIEIVHLVSTLQLFKIAVDTIHHWNSYGTLSTTHELIRINTSLHSTYVHMNAFACHQFYCIILSNHEYKTRINFGNCISITKMFKWFFTWPQKPKETKIEMNWWKYFRHRLH